jgi:4-amino-4-deoxy-L-arabinose transferase-like glycosyltransferase
VTSPNPALVSQREAQPLPRPAILLFCAAYVLPGVFGRDPWKSADITAFGYIVNIARGSTPWLAPTVGGLPSDGALLPYWIGAAFLRLTGSWLDPALAARLPFAALLVLALTFTWYATYHLARSDAAQPLPFAFGGEATPVDYARAIADGAVLAMIASLGLLQLGHETTPDLAQLAAVSLYLYGLAASPLRPLAGGAAVLVALPALAASGGPSVAMLLAVVGAGLSVASRQPGRLVVVIVAAAALAAAAASALGSWANRLGTYSEPDHFIGLIRTIAWFAWPTWLLALWTLWQWRRRLGNRHIPVPLGCAAAMLVVWLAMAGADRALMLALPPMAVLAAFALPTLKRSASAAIDWFSVFFFTIAAATVWLFYVSMQTGVPRPLGANIAKLSPGYANRFSLLALAFAVAGTVAWLWLVRWRAGRNRHPLWKSLVLPAGGVSLCWLLLMTLLLPPLDNARGYRSMIERIARRVPAAGCIAAPGASRPQVVALEYFGGYRIDALTAAADTPCEFLLLAPGRDAPGPAWEFVARERRLRNEDDSVDIYRRAAALR